MAYASAPQETQAFATAQQPVWQQPATRPPMVPPHPKRTGIVWFWPTLALIGIALGSLALYDDGHTVADGAYAALALAITGVMLLVGSLVGRPGGLIFVGIVSSIALAANVAVGGAFGTDARKLYAAPTSAAQVLPEERHIVQMGETPGSCAARLISARSRSIVIPGRH